MSPVRSTLRPDSVQAAGAGRTAPKPASPPQGESLAVWAMWAVVLGMIFVTYWRLPPDTPAAFAYGTVNAVQDTWNEQLVKRGTLDWRIPSAIHPSLAWVWVVMLALSAVTAVALRRESRRVRSAA